MSATSASAVELYNSVKTPTKTPDQQGFFKFSTNTAPVSSGKASAGGTTFDSGNIVNLAGYGRQAPITLDRIKGYSVGFSGKINTETHSNINSAGFNIIVTSNTLSGEKQPYGIQLSFWPGSIWANNPDFTHGEEVAFNNLTTVNNYSLVVKGDTYQLFINGSATPLLQGKLRQYPNFKPPSGFPNPYTLTNVIFLGDTSTTATSQFVITSISATQTTQVTVNNSPGK